MQQMLITIFNDINSSYAQSLQEAIASLDGINTLKHQPRVSGKRRKQRGEITFADDVKVTFPPK